MNPCEAVDLNPDVPMQRERSTWIKRDMPHSLHAALGCFMLIACHGHVRGLANNALRFADLAAWLANDRLGSTGNRRLAKPLKLPLLATVATSKCREDHAASKHHGPDKQQPETDLIVGGFHPRDINNSRTAAGVEMRARLEHVQHPTCCNQP